MGDEADLSLITKAFGVSRESLGKNTVDVDLFADALRGEIWPGRFRMLHRVYAQLQREDGSDLEESLELRAMEQRLCQAFPPRKRGQPAYEAEPLELMQALPLLRAHTKVPRAAFVRWMADLTFHLPDHASFVAQVSKMWGAGALAMKGREERVWSVLR